MNQAQQFKRDKIKYRMEQRKLEVSPIKGTSPLPGRSSKLKKESQLMITDQPAQPTELAYLTGVPDSPPQAKIKPQPLFKNLADKF